jgi:Skp family chaperone for outer membrane proteins
MKKLRWISLVVLLLAGVSRGADEIVFIDLEKVFDDFYKTQLAKSKVEIQQQDIEAERKIMVDELTTLSSEVDVLKKEARDITLTDEIRDNKRLSYEQRLLDLRTKQKEIEEFVARRQQQLQLQVSRMSQTIMDEIRTTVVEYAKKEGLKAVIDNSTRRAAIGVFIYTHSDAEITGQILALLNSRRPDVLDEGGLFDDALPAADESEMNPAGTAAEDGGES